MVSYQQLTAKNIYIRRPMHEELAFIKYLWADEATMQEVGGPINLSTEEAERWFTRMITPDIVTDFYCLIFTLADDIPVGEVSFHRYDHQTKTAQLNIKILAAQRGQGYGKEALLLLLGYYFLEFGGQVMVDEIANANHAGQKALLRCGFHHDPSREDVFLVRLSKEKFRELYNEDEYFMRKAIALARDAREQGEDPFGAVLVREGTLVHLSGDKSIQLSDPTAHAEVSVIREYCQQGNLFSLEGYTLYTSTEPCTMCSGAIHWAKISRVVFSVSQEMLQEQSGGRPKLGSAVLLNQGKNKVEVVGPLLPEEGLKVFAGFEFVAKAVRHRKRFVS